MWNNILTRQGTVHRLCPFTQEPTFETFYSLCADLASTAVVHITRKCNVSVSHR